MDSVESCRRWKWKLWVRNGNSLSILCNAIDPNDYNSFIQTVCRELYAASVVNYHQGMPWDKKVWTTLGYMLTFSFANNEIVPAYFRYSLKNIIKDDAGSSYHIPASEHKHNSFSRLTCLRSRILLIYCHVLEAFNQKN